MAADGAHVALLPMKSSPGPHQPSKSSPARSNMSSPSQQNLSPSRKAIMEKFSHIQMSASPNKAPLGTSRRINGDNGTTPFQRALLKSSQKTSTQDSPRRQQQSPPARLRDLNRPPRVTQAGPSSSSSAPAEESFSLANLSLRQPAADMTLTGYCDLMASTDDSYLQDAKQLGEESFERRLIAESPRRDRAGRSSPSKAAGTATPKSSQPAKLNDGRSPSLTLRHQPSLSTMSDTSNLFDEQGEQSLLFPSRKNGKMSSKLEDLPEDWDIATKQNGSSSCSSPSSARPSRPVGICPGSASSTPSAAQSASKPAVTARARPSLVAPSSARRTAATPSSSLAPRASVAGIGRGEVAPSPSQRTKTGAISRSHSLKTSTMSRPVRPEASITASARKPLAGSTSVSARPTASIPSTPRFSMAPSTTVVASRPSVMATPRQPLAASRPSTITPRVSMTPAAATPRSRPPLNASAARMRRLSASGTPGATTTLRSGATPSTTGPSTLLSSRKVPGSQHQLVGEDGGMRAPVVKARLSALPTATSSPRSRLAASRGVMASSTASAGARARPRSMIAGVGSGISTPSAARLKAIESPLRHSTMSLTKASSTSTRNIQTASPARRAVGAVARPGATSSPLSKPAQPVTGQLAATPAAQARLSLPPAALNRPSSATSSSDGYGSSGSRAPSRGKTFRPFLLAHGRSQSTSSSSGGLNTAAEGVTSPTLDSTVEGSTGDSRPRGIASSSTTEETEDYFSNESRPRYPSSSLEVRRPSTSPDAAATTTTEATRPPTSRVVSFGRRNRVISSGTQPPPVIEEATHDSQNRFGPSRDPHHHQASPTHETIDIVGEAEELEHLRIQRQMDREEAMVVERRREQREEAERERLALERLQKKGRVSGIPLPRR